MSDQSDPALTPTPSVKLVMEENRNSSPAPVPVVMHTDTDIDSALGKTEFSDESGLCLPVPVPEKNASGIDIIASEMPVASKSGNRNNGDQKGDSCKTPRKKPACGKITASTTRASRQRKTAASSASSGSTTARTRESRLAVRCRSPSAPHTVPTLFKSRLSVPIPLSGNNSSKELDSDQVLQSDTFELLSERNVKVERDDGQAREITDRVHNLRHEAVTAIKEEPMDHDDLLNEMPELDSSSAEPQKRTALIKDILFGDSSRAFGGDGRNNYTVANAQLSLGEGSAPVYARLQTARRGGGGRNWQGGQRNVVQHSTGELTTESSSGSVRLKNLQGRRTTKRGRYLEKDEEEWIAYAPGLNVEGTCKNPLCISHNPGSVAKPTRKQRYGRSKIYRPMPCPACNQFTLMPETILVSNARSFITLKKTGVNVGESTLMEHKGSILGFVTPDVANDTIDYDLVDVVTVKPGKSPCVCDVCGYRIKTKANEIRKQCGHVLHKRGCSTPGNCRRCSAN